MEVSTEELLMFLGEAQVKIRLLEREVMALRQQLEEKDAESSTS